MQKVKQIKKKLQGIGQKLNVPEEIAYSILQKAVTKKASSTQMLSPKVTWFEWQLV